MMTPILLLGILVRNSGEVCWQPVVQRGHHKAQPRRVPKVAATTAAMYLL